MSSTLAELMALDCGKVSNTIVDFIRRKVAEEKREGIVLGLSGGIDSAVAAILVVRAVGPNNVYALHLFDRQSDRKFRQYANGIATMLRINFEVRDITASVRALGTYQPFIMRIPPRASLVLMRLSVPVSSKSATSGPGAGAPKTLVGSPRLGVQALRGALTSGTLKGEGFWRSLPERRTCS